MSRILRLALAAASVCALVPLSRPVPLAAQGGPAMAVPVNAYQGLRWRSVGAARGGRVTGLAGVRQQPHTFYIGASGGGVWKTDDAGISWRPIGDGQITTGSIGAVEVAPSNPSHVWVGTGSAPIRSNVIIGRGVFKSTDAGANFQFVGLKDVGQIGVVRIHPGNPDVVWVAASGSPFGPGADRGVYKTGDGGKTWKKTLFVDNDHGARDLEVDWQNPDVLYAGMYRGFRKGWDIISGGPADKGGIYKSTDGGETWKKITAGLPATLIGKIDIDIARSNPRVLFAMIEAPGAEGGLYRSSDAGESWAVVNSSQRLRARPFYFNYVHVNPKNENEVWVNELGLHKSSDAGKTFTTVETPHGDNHGMWFNPDNPDIILQINDGGGNVSLNGGKSWSSILNQPHAEYYMVGVDEQHPYRLYVPQQDNTTLIVPSNPAVSWGLDHPAEAWVQASGCETGQIWPRKDGSVIWGACKGEVGRYSVATGQEQHYWIYPQNRYGHDPDEIKFRFPRQTVVYLSPHDDKIVYQASHVLHRSLDEGRHLGHDQPRPHRARARVPDHPGHADHPRHHRRRGLQLDLRDDRVAPREGRDRGRRQRRPGQHHPRQRQDVEAGHAEGSRARRPHPDGRGQPAPEGHVLHRRLPLHARTRPEALHLQDGRLRRDLDAADERHQRHPGRPPDPRRARGPEAPGAALCRHRVRRVRLVQRRDVVADAAAEPPGHPGDRHQGAPQRPGRQHHGPQPVDHGRRVAAAATGRPLRAEAGEPEQQRRRGNGAGGPAPGATAAPTSLPAAYLFQPQDAMRYRYVPTPPSAAEPEYSVPGAHFDLFFAAPPADARLEVKDGAGTVIRSFAVAGARGGAAAQDMRGPFRRLGGSTAIESRAGAQRFTWDMRYPGPWTAGAPNGGAGGPLAPPGKYSVSLTAGGQTTTRTFALVVDPRVTRDGVTPADLEAQVAFQLKVRDAISETRQLAERVNEAMQKAGVKPPAAAPVGARPMDTNFTHPLQKVWASLNDMPGAYPQPMLLNQFNTVQRMVGQADQRVGQDAVDRYDDLMKVLATLQAEFKTIG